MGLPDRDELCTRFDDAIAAARARRPDPWSTSAAVTTPAVYVVGIDGYDELVRLDAVGMSEAMAEVVRRLDRLVRSGDLLARTGPGTLVLAATSVAPEVAGALVERIAGAVVLPLDLDGQTVSLGATVGVGLARADEDAATILARAEADLQRQRGPG